MVVLDWDSICGSYYSLFKDLLDECMQSQQEFPAVNPFLMETLMCFLIWVLAVRKVQVSDELLMRHSEQENTPTAASLLSETADDD